MILSIIHNIQLKLKKEKLLQLDYPFIWDLLNAPQCIITENNLAILWFIFF